MSAYLFYIKMGAIALLVALAAFGSWYATSDHYEKIIAENQVESDKAVQAQQETVLALMAADAAQRKEAEEEHAQDQLVVNDLSTQLAGVRIHIPQGGCGLRKKDASGADPNRGSGLLSDRVDEVFARLQARVGQLVQRCDQLNIDARQANAVNK